MKKSKLILLALSLLMAGCSKGTSNSIDFSKIESNDYSEVSVKGELGDFDLISPTNNMIVDSVSEFSWTESTNAETYSLEICSSDQFISNISTIDYYISKNITATSFKINSELAFKETTYYWRVTAKNDDGVKQSSSIFSFFIKAPEVEEVKFDLGEADDWQLHSAGSYADIGIDNNNFFGNNEKSLVVSFKKEDTSQGKPGSDGWIIVTKTFEKSIYGTDALFFNLYYSGQDSRVIIRLIDRDNEFWYCPVQVSNNAKQQIILKFSDFIQRTGDVTVANEVFDYERIKYFEVVFERTFGDGVLLLSNVKAIKFDNYREYFIEKLDFTEFDESYYTHEAYEFERVATKDELELKFYGTNDLGKPKINGYGFAKINVNRYLFTGDSIKMSLKYSGAKGSNVILRVYEEDKDRWSYKIPYSNLSSEEYMDVVLPYEAFVKSSIGGDGRRQFYFILNLQFGLEGQYGTGSIFFKDFEIVKKADFATEKERVVNDGMIEDFNNYTFGSELYLIWSQSINNKDEFMTINSSYKVGGQTNLYCGQFEYKSDMEAATYTIPIKASGDYTSLSLWLKDASTKSGDIKVSEVEDIRPNISIYIRLATSEIYEYRLESIDRVWNNYDLPFEDFELTNDNDLSYPAKPITADTITHIALSISYLYYVKGEHVPVYSISNIVYLDNIRLTNEEEFNKNTLEKVVSMDGDIALVDDFESYKNTSEVVYSWNNGRDYDYQKMELSNDVSSEGGKNSLKLQFKTKNESPAYYISPAIASDVTAKGVRVSLKCDVGAVVYVNIYLIVSGNTIQYRATINPVATVWTEYVIGFNNFSEVNGSSRALSSKDVIYMSRFSFGVVYYQGTDIELKNLYVDNIKFDKSVSYGTNTSRVI